MPVNPTDEWLRSQGKIFALLRVILPIGYLDRDLLDPLNYFCVAPDGDPGVEIIPELGISEIPRIAINIA